MDSKQTIHVFDVDGTITVSDSFMELLRYFNSSKLDWFYTWLRATPVLVSGILRRDLAEAKLFLLSRLWKGKRQQDIYHDCFFFFNNRMKPYLRLKACAHIEQLQQNKPDEKIVLLSASCREWIIHLAIYLDADLICTELKYDEQQQFTGLYATPNCKGIEKKRRLLEKYPADKFEFVSYGNTSGDKALRCISKQFFYRYF